jgi:multimeric flavodoxin WrbA
MKVKFIIYSHTGHTKTVAENFQTKLLSSSHCVVMDYIQTKEKLDLKADIVEIKEMPMPQGQDVVIIGSPVHGGRVSAPIRAFLSQVTSLEGIRIILLVTHFFRPGWGAVQTLQDMRNLCEYKGGEVIGVSHIKWFSLNRKRQINKMSSKVCSLIP